MEFRWFNLRQRFLRKPSPKRQEKSSPERIYLPDLQSLPSLQEIEKRVTRGTRLLFYFAEKGNAEDLRQRLEAEVKLLQTTLSPDYHVYTLTGKENGLGIAKVIGEDEVLAIADELVVAAQWFRTIAMDLVPQLAEHLEVPVESFHPGQKRDFLKKGWGGQMPDGWMYDFHGYECRFANDATGQVLDVRLEFGEEFGVLSPMFFRQFLETTEQYHPLVYPFVNDSDMKRAFEILAKHRKLEKLWQVIQLDT